MMKWSKEILANNDALEPATQTGEVFILERMEKGDRMENGKRVERGYAIYKLVNSNAGVAYVLAMENDLAPSLYNPPILLTEDEVLEFLNNPEKAAAYTYNKWFNCYR